MPGPRAPSDYFTFMGTLKMRGKYEIYYCGLFYVVRRIWVWMNIKLNCAGHNKHSGHINLLKAHFFIRSHAMMLQQSCHLGNFVFTITKQV